MNCHACSLLLRGINDINIYFFPVATPGRLIDFAERGYISFENLEYFVLDEADR